MNFETLRGILTYLEENANDALLFSLKRENTNYQPPLSAAARNGRDDLVNLLLDKGANGEQLRYVHAESVTIFNQCASCLR